MIYNVKVKDLSLLFSWSKQKANEPGVNNLGLAIGLSLGCFAVMAIVVAFFVSKSNGFRRGQLSFFRSGERKSFGRPQFRPETRLNVIENPIEKLEVRLPILVSNPLSVLVKHFLRFSSKFSPFAVNVQRAFKQILSRFKF